MAVVPLLVRLAIPVGVWLTRTELKRYIEGWIVDSTIDEGYEGSTVMAEWSGDVELRKLAVRWSRSPSGGVPADVCVCTWTFLRLDGDTPSVDWSDDSHYTTIESAFGTFWSSIKELYPSWTHLDQLRWYADGPAFRPTPPEGNPARRVTEVDVAGTGDPTECLPPQAAISVTEKTLIRKEWGRFYLPAPRAYASSSQGRINTASLDQVADAVEIFYNACRAAALVPVVFAPALPERPKKPTGTLPARTGVVYEVTSTQVDDTFDVIRSRRWNAPVVRDSRVLAPL